MNTTGHKTVYVSQSGLRVAHCPRAIALALRARLRKRWARDYMLRGAGIHRLLAEYLMGTEQSEAVSMAVKTVQADATLGTKVQPIIDEIARIADWVYRDGGIARVLDEQKLTPISVETRFAYIRRNNRWNRSVVVRGVLDVITSTPHGICVVDFKTTQRGGSTLFSTAEYDLQPLLYTKAASLNGFNVTTFCYFGIVLTKEIQVVLRFLPYNTQDSDRVWNEVFRMGFWAARQPDDPVEIIRTVVGNPAQCSMCTFRDLCKYQSHIRNIIETEFTTVSPDWEYEPDVEAS